MQADSKVSITPIDHPLYKRMGVQCFDLRLGDQQIGVFETRQKLNLGFAMAMAEHDIDILELAPVMREYGRQLPADTTEIMLRVGDTVVENRDEILKQGWGFTPHTDCEVDIPHGYLSVPGAGKLAAFHSIDHALRYFECRMGSLGFSPEHAIVVLQEMLKVKMPAQAPKQFGAFEYLHILATTN